MEKNKCVSYCLLITGSMMCLLGVAHMAIAVPMGLKAVESIPNDDSLPLTLGNIVTALAVFGAGLLTIYCVRGVSRAEQWAWTVGLGASIFMTLVGFGYILITPANPFAYLAFVVALGALVPLVLSRHSSHRA